MLLRRYLTAEETQRAIDLGYDYLKALGTELESWPSEHILGKVLRAGLLLQGFPVEIVPQELGELGFKSCVDGIRVVSLGYYTGPRSCSVGLAIPGLGVQGYRVVLPKEEE